MPLISTTSADFIKDRFEKTVAAQHILTTNEAWVYEPVPIAEWDGALIELDAGHVGNEEHPQPSLAYLAAQTSKVRSQKMGLVDARYATLHRLTVQAVLVMRSRALADEDLRPVVDELSARGDSNRVIEDEAGELLVAWKLAFGETFTPAKGNTLAGLAELLEGKKDAQGAIPTPSVRQLKSEYKDATAADRSAQAKVNKLLGKLEDQCIAWYAEAAAVFPAGTPSGDTIRGTVPTSDQYAPGSKPVATPAHPAAPAASASTGATTPPQS